MTVLRFEDVRLVARQDLLDFVRDRDAMKRLLRSPLTFVAMLAFFSVLSVFGSGSTSNRTASRAAAAEPRLHTLEAPHLRIAVRGVDVTSPLLSYLRSNGFEVQVESTGAADALPSDTDAVVSVVGVQQAQQSLRVMVRDGSDAVRNGALVSVALERYARLEAAEAPQDDGGAPVSERVHVDPRVLAVSGRSGGTSFGAAPALGLLAPFLVFPMLSLIGIAAERITGARDRRVIEPLLVTPLHRPSVIVGKGLSALGIGLMSIAATTLPIVVVISAVAIATHAALNAPSLPLGLLTGLVPIAAVAVAWGLLTGARSASGSSQAVANRGVFFLVPFLIFAMSSLTNAPLAQPAVLLVPLLGPVLVLRLTFIGGFRPLYAVAALPTLATAAVLLVLATRHFAHERSVLRATA